MTNDTALLQAIRADLDDDGPRLVYADWLEEHGDPERGELIRVQCELARLAKDDPRRDQLVRRERVLLGRNRERWLAGLPAWARRERCRFRRGFPADITTTGRKLSDDAAALWVAAPLEEVHVRRLRPHLPEILAL